MATPLLDLPLLRQHLVFLSQVLEDPECVHTAPSLRSPWKFAPAPAPQLPPIHDSEHPPIWEPPEWWASFCGIINASAGRQRIDPNLKPSRGWLNYGAIALVGSHLIQCGFEESKNLDLAQLAKLHNVTRVLTTHEWRPLVMCQIGATVMFRQLLQDTIAVLPSGENESSAPCTTSNAPQPIETRASERGTQPPTRNRRIKKAEAEILVGDWLTKNATKENAASVTREALHDGTGVSTGQISNTGAWKAFCKRRDEEAKRGLREVPLSDKMQATIPADCPDPAALAALMEEDENERKQNERPRRQKRRHDGA
jgi:hypothetical protein